MNILSNNQNTFDLRCRQFSKAVFNYFFYLFMKERIKRKGFIKLLLLVSIITSLLVIFITLSSSVLAISGACSWHDGVNCNAGPDWDGSVICNDGWRDSTVDYYSMDECFNIPRCTSSELESLQQKYEISGLWAEIQSQTQEIENLYESYNLKIAERDMAVAEVDNIGMPQSWIDSRKTVIANEYSTELNRISTNIEILTWSVQQKKQLLKEIQNQISDECESLGYDRYFQDRLENLKKQQALNDDLREKEQSEFDNQQTEMEALLKQSCPDNSYYSDGKCICNNDYVFDNNICISADEYCRKHYDNNMKAQEGLCICIDGYVMRDNKCITRTEDCIRYYGANFCATTTEEGENICICADGYELTSGQTCIKSIICPANSKKENNTCVCDDEYIMQDDKCKTYTEYCIQKFGSNVYGTGYNDNVSCHCKDGYEWNSEGTGCVEEIKLQEENKKDVEISKRKVTGIQQQEEEIVEQGLEKQKQEQEQQWEEEQEWKQEQEQEPKRIIFTFLASISATVKNFFHRLSYWF